MDCSFVLITGNNAAGSNIVHQEEEEELTTEPSRQITLILPCYWLKFSAKGLVADIYPAALRILCSLYKEGLSTISQHSLEDLKIYLTIYIHILEGSPFDSIIIMTSIQHMILAYHHDILLKWLSYYIIILASLSSDISELYVSNEV